MSDDLKNRGAQDRARINIHEEHELRYFGRSEDELKKAVEAAGCLGRSCSETSRKFGMMGSRPRSLNRPDLPT